MLDGSSKNLIYEFTNPPSALVAQRVAEIYTGEEFPDQKLVEATTGALVEIATACHRRQQSTSYAQSAFNAQSQPNEEDGNGATHRWVIFRQEIIDAPQILKGDKPEPIVPLSWVNIACCATEEGEHVSATTIGRMTKGLVRLFGKSEAEILAPLANALRID